MISFFAFRDELEKIAGARGFAQGVGKNLAGAVGAIASPIKSTRKGVQMLKNDFGRMGLGGKAFFVGSQGLALTQVPGMVKKEDPSGRGESRATRVGRFAGSQVGGLVGVPYGLSGGILASEVGSRVGAAPGRAIDKIRAARRASNPTARRLPQTPTPPPPEDEVLQ